MPNNNVAILSIMSKFDEKSAREAAERANKVYDEALSDIGNVNFDKKLLENFDKAMNLLKNKFKKVNLSSYTNSLLDSIFSDKDIKEKSKDIELFISKIEMLKKASSGQDINAFNTFSAKQIDALISRTEKLAQKQEEINEKTREYNREATKIAKANRSISTIDKNYGNQDYSKTLESLKKSLGTEKEFTAEQNQSIENLAKMVNLYQIMEKSEPQKGTAEAIRYSKDLLAVTQKIKEERDKIDAFSQKGASTYIANNGLSSVDKVNEYTVNKSKEDFVKASLSNLKSQEAKLQSELTTYISDSVQKNLAKVSKEVDAVVDKAEKRVENLQNKIESLQTKSTNTGSDNSIIGGIVSDGTEQELKNINNELSQIGNQDTSDLELMDKALENIKDNFQDVIKYAVDAETAFNKINELYKKFNKNGGLEKSELIDIVSFNDRLNMLDQKGLSNDKYIINNEDMLDDLDFWADKYGKNIDRIQKMTIEQIEEAEKLKSIQNEAISNSNNSQTEQLVKQEEQIKQTVQAEEKLLDTQDKLSTNTKISVDAEQAIADINKIKESLDSIPEEKNIKITISDSDYTNTPLLSNELGEVVTAFRGVKDAWSGLVNDKGIGFFTDKLKLAVDYADELSKDGKVYQANLSFHNPLEVDGKGARWDQIDFNGIKQKTDDIIQLAKQLGHDGVIFKNIRDGFTDTDEDISNVMVALNAAQIKNEQVIGAVKAGTGEMVDVASKIDNATDTATNSTVESQNKIQEELKETQKVAEQVSEAMNNVGSDKSNISSENVPVIEQQIKKQNEYNDLVSVGYDRIQKMKKISESGTTGSNSVYNLLRLNHKAWDEVKANNFFNTIPEEGLQRYTKILEVVEKIVQEMVKASGLTESQIISQLKDIKTAKGGNFKLNGADSGWTHFATYSNGQKDSMQKPNGITYKVYAAFDDIKDLNQNVVSSIMEELTKAGFKGRLKTTSGSTSFGDKLNGLAITDQMVVHGSTKKDQEIAYNVLKNIGVKLSYLGGGIDTPDGSFSQTLASGEINKYIQGLEKEAVAARDAAKAEQQLADSRKDSSVATPMKDVFQGNDNSNTSFSSNLDEIEKEKSALLELRNTVSLIIEEIDRKTQAFHNEKSAVDLIIPEEIATLESLERELKIIIESIEQISKIPINIDFNLENLDEKSANVISKLKDSLSGFNGSSLTNISSILEGFKISKANVENLQKLANAILTLKSNLNNVGNSGQQFLSDIKELVAQSDGLKDLATVLKSSQKQIDNAKKTTNANVDSKNTKENANTWKELTYSIQRYSEVSKRISSGKALEGDVEEASRLENKISQLQKLDILSPTQIEKSEQMLTKLYDTLDDIEKKSKETTLESLNSSIDKYRNDYNSRSSKPFVYNQSDEYKKRLANYKTSIEELEAYRDKISNSPLVSKEDLNQIDELIKKVKESATAFNSLTASQKGSTPLSRGKTIEWANDLLEQNSKWSKKAKIEVQGWINKLATADPSNVEEIRNRILEIVRAEREAGNAGKTWLDIFSTKKLHNFLGQAASMFSFYDLVNVGREGFQIIRELDTALVDLKKTTAMNSSQLEEFYFDSNDVAKQMGVTTQAIIEQASAWSRLGYNTKEQATQMAELSSQFASISPGMSTETAQEGLVSIMKAWDIDVNDVKSEIMDPINMLGNSFAETNEDIVEGMKRSAAALSAVGTSYKEAFSLFTGAQEIMQNAEVTGRALRSVSLRVRGYSEESEDGFLQLDEDLKNVTGDLIDLTKTAKHAQGVSIFKDGSTTEFKSLVDYFGEINAIWDEMTQKQQNDFLQKAFGKTQAQAGAAIIKNYDAVAESLRKIEESAGSADREMSIIEQSLEYKMNALKETWVGTVQEMIDRGDLGTLIDGLTGLSEAIGFVLGKAGLLGSVGIGAGIFSGINNVGEGKMYPSILF